MGEYKCPHCKNPIYDNDALLCHFCGESLDKSSKGALGKMRGADPKIGWIFIVLWVLVGFVLLTLFIRR